MTTQLDKANKLKSLHEGDRTFVIPGPWDAGSARAFDRLGYEALATTSGGFAFALGRVDGTVTLDEKIAHVQALTAVTDLPISTDLEHGYADSPQGVAETILKIAEAGAVGGSIEDYSRSEIYDFNFAVERVQAAAEAAATLDFPFALVGRCENQLRRQNDLDDTIRRLQAYADAGADVLFAPGLRTIDEVRQVTSEISKPLNVLSPMLPGVTVAELADAGVRRISFGGALAMVAYGAMVEGARQTIEEGNFAWLSRMSPENDIAPLLS